MGSHQLNAHWSLAYACGLPPEAWEVYRSPGLFVMSSTDFFERHRNEIQDALRPRLTWELLRDHALPKLALEAKMTESECKAHSYPGKVQYIDPDLAKWSTADVPAIRWFDGREGTREALLETRAEFEAKIARNLARYRDCAANRPSAAASERLASYEKFIRDLLLGRLLQFEKQQALSRKWLAKIERTPDFAKSLFTLIRQAENEVRAARGIAAVGEAWVGETELLYRVRELLPGIAVIPHGQPKWLGRQHLDIWIPSLSVGIEYHGAQHFRPVEFFGGEAAFLKAKERDERKRTLCAANSIRLGRVVN